MHSWEGQEEARVCWAGGWWRNGNKSRDLSGSQDSWGFHVSCLEGQDTSLAQKTQGTFQKGKLYQTGSHETRRHLEALGCNIYFLRVILCCLSPSHHPLSLYKIPPKSG